MTTDSNKQLRVFLCHASADKSAVRFLYKALCKEGIDVWLDEEKLLPGQDWDKEIAEAVHNSDVIVVCLSSQSVTKEGYVQKEIKFALNAADEKPENTIFIIPARLEECDVPTRLRRWHYVDLFFTDDMFSTKGYEMLIKALHVRANQLRVVPPITVPKSLVDRIFNPQEFDHPQLVILSGPTGLGIGVILQRMKERKLPMHFATAVTTRQRRPYEQQGEDYCFISSKKFAHLLKTNELLTYSMAQGEYEGVPKKQIQKALKGDKDVVVGVNVQQAEKLSQLVPNALLIFITVESEQQLINRMLDRKAETSESVNLKIATARKELTRINAFDFLVIDRDFHLDQTVDVLYRIIATERHRIRGRAIQL